MRSDPILLPAEAPRPQPFRFRRVFIGKEGMRAGWSALIFIVIFAIVATVGVLGVRKAHLVSEPTKAAPEISLSFGFTFEAIQVLAVLLATCIMAKIERLLFHRAGITIRLQWTGIRSR